MKPDLRYCCCYYDDGVTKTSFDCFFLGETLAGQSDMSIIYQMRLHLELHVTLLCFKIFT